MLYGKEYGMTYNTTARSRLLSFLQSNSERAFTLEEICGALLDGGHGRSTVYRLVPQLVGAGCVRRISDGRTRRVTYQFVGGAACAEHLHLKCNECGKLIHLDREISHALEDALKKSRGFTLDEGTLIFGRCKDCEAHRV